MLARLLALRAAKRGTRMGGGARRTMRQWLSSAEKQRQRRGATVWTVPKRAQQQKTQSHKVETFMRWEC